ncbi:MAG: hypothetical protein ACKVVP_14990 [Chloroflexota bacterium]
MHALASPSYQRAPRVWLVTPQTPLSPLPARRRQRRGHGVLQTAIVGVLFSLSVIFLVASVLAARGVQYFLIDGSGLEPSVPSGSLIVVDPMMDRALVVDDLVLVQDEAGNPTTGHVSEVVHGAAGLIYRTRNLYDSTTELRTTTAERIIGRVRLYVPFASDGFALLMSPQARGMAAAFAAAVALMRLLPLVRRRPRTARGQLAKPRQAGVLTKLN